jgi:cysteine-rich repeat protein
MHSLAKAATVAVATLIVAATCQAQSEGPNNATTIVDDASVGTTPWNAPGQAATSDNIYANVNPGTGTSHYLKATGFGFSIPGAAVILGIELDVEEVALGGTAFDNAVRIVKGGVIGATDRSLGAWPGVESVVTYGGPSDLWGETWTPADINAADFGAAISMHDSISGVLAQVDSIALTVYYGLCGDNIEAPNEGCDDGNTVDGDCCDSDCQNEPADAPCPDDGLPCTNDLCDGAGTCEHTNTPRNGCRTSLKAKLVYKDNATNTKDKLTWKWIKGQQTDFADFGVPTGTASYTLCLYASPATVLGEATVAYSGSKWSVIGANKGRKYKDKDATEDGIKKIVLKAGAPNKAKAIVKGKGDLLPDLPAMPFALPVTAQLVNDDNDICYTTTFTSALDNGNGKFRAKLP